jgi:hypothetical protein
MQKRSILSSKVKECKMFKNASKFRLSILSLQKPMSATLGSKKELKKFEKRLKKVIKLRVFALRSRNWGGLLESYRGNKKTVDCYKVT